MCLSLVLGRWNLICNFKGLHDTKMSFQGENSDESCILSLHKGTGWVVVISTNIKIHCTSLDSGVRKCTISTKKSQINELVFSCLS